MRVEDHRRYRELLGAYVSGRIEDPEAAELERHLRECASCRAEEAELRAVAALLPVADPSRQSADFDPSPDLEDRVVAAVVSERRAGERGGPSRVRRARFFVGLAAAVVVAAIGLFVILPAQQGSPGLGEEEPITFSGVPEGVSTDGAVVAHTWGTEVSMEIEGLEAGEVYTVRIEREAGDSVSAGTFVGVGAGPVECDLNGAVLRQNARAVIVTDSTGEEVLRSELEARPDLASVR